MAVAVNLQDAADKTAANLQPLWVASTLSAKMVLFSSTSIGQFPEATELNRPVADWLTTIGCFAPNIVAFSTPLDRGSLQTYLRSVDLVYRTCKLAYQMSQATPTPQITAGQAAALLAAYNAQFS